MAITLRFAGIFLVGASYASWGQTLSSNLRFTPITPCRVLDTRGGGFIGPFGQPSLAGGGRVHFR